MLLAVWLCGVQCGIFRSKPTKQAPQAYAPPSFETRAYSVLDAALDQAFVGLEAARTGLQRAQSGEFEGRLSPHPRFVGDAALAGCAAGFACGSILVGSPKLLAVCGAVSFSYAARCPERVPRWLDQLSDRSAIAMRRARQNFNDRIDQLD